MKTILAVLALVLSWTLPAAAADIADPVILVAKRQLHDHQHIGFIVNRPTKITLGQLFPDHPPSQKVPDPVFVGGPINPESIFALVQTSKHPGGRSVELMPGMFAVFDGKIVDDVMRGAWYVLDADPALVLRKPDGLWEELVRRAELRANGI